MIFLPLQNEHTGKTRTYVTVGHSVATAPDLKGKTPLLHTVVLLRALQFLPTIPLPGRGIPPMICQSVKQENRVERVTEMNKKIKKLKTLPCAGQPLCAQQKVKVIKIKFLNSITVLFAYVLACFFLFDLIEFIWSFSF